MTKTLFDFPAIYRAGKYADSSADAEVPQEGRALIRQYDEAVGEAVEDLGRALAAGDLAAARAAQRGLRVVSDAFGSAEWVLNA